MPVAASDLQTPRTVEVTDRAPPAIVLSVLAGFAAAWLASGSTGLLGRPLQLVLMWTALAVAILAAWPRKTSFGHRLLLSSAALFALLLTPSAIPAVQVLAVAVLLAALAQVHRLLPARLLLIASLSVTALGCYTLARSTVPAFWQVSDLIGSLLGAIVGRLVGQPLSVGATFAGLDYLVLTGAFCAAWLLCTPAPRRPRATWAAIAIVAAQFVYLAFLAYSRKLFTAIPEPILPLSDSNHVGLWTWSGGIRSLIPWNLPLLALLLHSAIIAGMIRLVPWLPVVEVDPRELERKEEEERKKDVPGSVIVADMLFRFGPVLLAIAVALSGSLALNRPDLQGKKIVAYDRGYLDWLKPEYDSSHQGFYGLLPMYVASLGGEFTHSRDLTADELAKADVLLAIHPDQPWPQDVLQRVWEFVRRGGSLLVVAEPPVSEPDSKSSFNELLAPSSIRVQLDTAVAQTGGWSQSYTPLSHASTLGMNDLRNPFGIQVGPSLRVSWPAQPVIIGQWGWSDPGTDAAVTGRSPYSTSERLGDLVLAAEQPFGAGRVFVLSDTLPLRNEVLAASHPFVGRLLASLAYKNTSPQALWRQLLTLLSLVAMLGLLAARPEAWQCIVTPAALIVSLLACTAASHGSGHLLPDGRSEKSERLNFLAYIDASHLPAYSSDLTAAHGIKHLQQTLMRHGFLPLLATDLSKERLERAALLISIGPARELTSAEHQAIKTFVSSGGTFLVMVGANESRPSAAVLAEFGLRVPPSPVPTGEDTHEPEPHGALSAPLDSPQRQYHFYAAWPVESLDGSGGKMVSPSDNRTWAYVYRRSEGAGTVVVIGDTHFASNENFAPENRRDNNQVLFWRWLLSNVMRGEEPWSPAPAADHSIDDPAEKSAGPGKQGVPEK